MRKTLLSKIAQGQDICVFCAFRPRVQLRREGIRSLRDSRNLSTSSSVGQSQAVAPKADRDEDDDEYTMLRENAATSKPFPTRTRPQLQSATSDTSESVTPGGSFRTSNLNESSRRQVFRRIFPLEHHSVQTTSPPFPTVNGTDGGSDADRYRAFVPQKDAISSFPAPGRLPASHSSWKDKNERGRNAQNAGSSNSTERDGSRDQKGFQIRKHFAPSRREPAHPATAPHNGAAVIRNVSMQKEMSGGSKSRIAQKADQFSPFASRRGQERPSPQTQGNTRAEADLDSFQAPAGSSFDFELDPRQMRTPRRRSRSERLAIDEEEDVVKEPQRKATRRRVSQFDLELAELEENLYGGERRKKQKGKGSNRLPKEAIRPVLQLPEFISVERLARLLKLNVDSFIEKLEDEGFEGARYDHVLDAGTSSMFADLYGFEPIFADGGTSEDLVARPPPEDISLLPPRPPIVTIMGHVDHGKTTILDYLRKTSVVAGEHGGITQHIGAFSVRMPGSDRDITFLDTPGHAAFLEMRRRGANVTDIVVLVVAADDSVKPQTIEAIKHAIEANVQIIVAINKVDKEDADIERVKQDLTRHNVVVEDYGGEYQVIPVSGKTGQGMSELEEAILTLADVNDFRAEQDGPAEGSIIESKIAPGLGRVATVLVRRGTLRPGDFIVAGTTWARVRTLRNDTGQLVDEALPGTPVQVDGWRGEDPVAGLEVLQAASEEHAKDVVALRQDQEENIRNVADMAAINTAKSDHAEARAKVLEWESEQEWSRKSHRHRPKDNEGWIEPTISDGPKLVHFIIKADVAGSAEALAHAVSAIGNQEIRANVIQTGTGLVSESDVQRLAATGEKGYLISFNQRVEGMIARLAETAGLGILDYNIIYKVTDEVKQKLSDELPPIVTQRVVGEAEIGQIFEISAKRNKVKIAGCKITNGTISRSHRIRVLRNGEVVYTGTLNSLKNVKKDVTEMRKGTECGIGFEDWEDFLVKDQIQCFEEIEEKRALY